MDRTQLFDTLSNLPPAAFERLLFALKPPGGLIPGDTAPQMNRVKALLDWAEGSSGRGTDEICAYLNQLQQGTLLIQNQDLPNFQPYLQSILENEDYTEWQEVYTPTTVEDRRRVPMQDATTVSQRRFSSRLKLRVETVKPDQQAQGNQPDGAPKLQERVEQWDVLAGLRNYAAEHVVLTGKPGSGKSTSLERLLWEEAENALDDPTARIPVLVKLRRCTGTIEGLIRDFLVGHQVALEIAQVEELLRQGRFLLLLDGLNELPKAFETEVANFRDRYRRTTPTIVSTRDLGGGSTLGIGKKLKMLPLTEPQMREFVRGYLGEDGDQLFQQLSSDRLREFAETPLLLFMLCWVFDKNGHVPSNLGLAFREFTQLHDKKIQEDAPAESKDQWPKLLRHLAFALMHDKELVEFRLSMSREEAENLFTDFLQKEGRTNARGNAERCLQDLLDYHLIQPVIQPNFEEHIEFRHQLIQEYYAAEHLLRLLPDLSDEQLKRDYLNLLKWTEAIALMLALVSDESQALRVVKLAMNDIDLMLGSRLAGEVNQLLQEKALCTIAEFKVSVLFEIILLGRTRSEYAIPKLRNFLLSQVFDDALRDNSARAIGEIGNQEAIKCLIQAVESEDDIVFGIASHWLGKIGGKDATNTLLKFLSHKNSYFRQRAADALGYISEEQVVFSLCKILEDKEVELYASLALARIGESIELPYSCQNLSKGILSKYQNPTPREDRKIIEDANQESNLNDDEKVICQQLINENLSPLALVDLTGSMLGRHGKDAYPYLLGLLNHRKFAVRFAAARALAEVGYKKVLPILLEGITSKDSFFYTTSSIALKRIGDPDCISQMYILLANIERIRPLHFKSILDVISAIQSRCKFYNYKIFHGIIPQGEIISLYVSYAPADAALQTQLSNHLTLLERQGVITSWSSHQIFPGSDRTQTIHQQLNTADIILLLISPDAIADDTCYHLEVQRAMERHQSGQARVIPILLRPVDWQGAPFGQLDVLPKNHQPVTTWPNQDQAFQEIAEGIRTVAMELRKEKPGER